MIIRVAKCRFTKLKRWFVRSEWKTINQSESYTKGVLCGLDKSHNADYEVEPCSAPLLAVHAKPENTHGEIKEQLQHLNLWMDEFRPVKIPRKKENGDPTYAPGYISLPRSASRVDRYISQLEQASSEFAFTSSIDAEVHLDDIQQSLSNFATAHRKSTRQKVRTLRSQP